MGNKKKLTKKKKLDRLYWLPTCQHIVDIDMHIWNSRTKLKSHGALYFKNRASRDTGLVERTGGEPVKYGGVACTKRNRTWWWLTTNNWIENMKLICVFMYIILTNLADKDVWKITCNFDVSVITIRPGFFQLNK